MIKRLILLFLLTGLFFPRISQAQAIRILPLGDSYTEGGYNMNCQKFPEGKLGKDCRWVPENEHSENCEWFVSGGYRGYLKSILNTNGFAVDFVGSRTSGPVPGNDIEHEGHSGLRIGQVAMKIPEILRTQKPDIVLIMLGTNDIIQNFDLPNAPFRLISMVEAILRSNPAIRVILASPIPTDNCMFNVRLYEFNSHLKAYVKVNDNPRLQFIDMLSESGIKRKDFTDGVHPTPEGYEKIAKAWWRAIKRMVKK